MEWQTEEKHNFCRDKYATDAATKSEVLQISQASIVKVELAHPCPQWLRFKYNVIDQTRDQLSWLIFASSKACLKARLC